MQLRRAIPLAFVALASACGEPSVPYDPAAHNPSSVDYAVFDPQPDPVDNSPADIPLPSDLALQPQAIATQSGAQKEVLQSFAAQGGWPADQDLALTFDFVRIKINPDTGATTREAPALDVSTINPTTLLILSISSTGAVAVVPYDPPAAADYAVVGDHGTLTIHKTADASGLRHWDPGTYVAAVRGGLSGVKVTGGGVVNPRPAMYLITQGADLSRPENQGLIPGNTREEKATAAAQLEQLRKAFLLPFQVLAGAGIPTNQIASMTAFTVTSRVRVVADPVAAAAGSATALPFPSDFLFKPGTHTLIDQITSPSGPFGPLGPGLATLDGFSTTALITVDTSGLVDPTTINKDTVFLYELTATGPKRVPEANEASATVLPGFAAVSGVLAQKAGLSSINVIALQPATPIPAPSLPLKVLAIPPLKEGTEYAVVTTDGITEPGGAKTVQATLGRLLALNNSLLAGGQATVAGLDPAQAAQLEPMRLALGPVLDDLAATKGITRDHVTMAYTFRTQGTVDAAHSIDNSYQTTAGLLAALPYGTPSSAASPLATPNLYCNPGLIGAHPACPAGTAVPTTTVFSQYSVDTTKVPFADIGFVAEAPIAVFNKLRCTAADATATPPKCVDTGAFGGGSTATPVSESANALVAVPLPPYVLAKEGATCVPTASAPCSVPLVVFHHGLGGSRADMLLVADHLTKAGFVVAAIDMNKHGDRSYCSSNVQCVAGGTCNPIADMVNEGDAPGATPGKCSTDFLRDTSGCPTCDNSKAPVLSAFTFTGPNAGRGTSANFILSFNLFRTRDTFRQDMIDQSQLIRVLSPDPTCDTTAAPPPTGTPGGSCANGFITLTTGVQIDPARIYMLGQSLGGIATVPDAAANPRVRKMGINAAGSTIVDVFSNSLVYAPALNALLDSKGIGPSNSSGYLQFLTTAKWVLDPADPENFAQNISASTIPSPLSGGVAPPGRGTLQQISVCDDHVPTTYQLNLASLLGLGPADASHSTASLWSALTAPSATCSTGGQIEHGFLLDWNVPAVAGQAQDDFANFFVSSTNLPPPARP